MSSRQEQAAPPVEPDRALTLGVFMSVCDADAGISEHTLEALAVTTRPHRLRLFIVDDGPSHDVGRRLADRARGLDIEVAWRHGLAKPLGFRGCIERTCRGLQAIADDVVAHDLAIKIDPDALPLRRDLGQTLTAMAGERASLWGAGQTMRRRDAVLMLADLLPMGFRRRTVNGQIVRGWQLSRLRPVWWAGIGLAALRRGYRFRFVNGGFYVLSGDLLATMARRGWLARPRQHRHGFVTSEEDVMVTLMALAAGGRWHDLKNQQPGWHQLTLPPSMSAQEILRQQCYVVHPLKAGRDDLARREAVWAAMQPINADT